MTQSVYEDTLRSARLINGSLSEPKSPKGQRAAELVVTKDQFTIWSGFLEADMEAKLMINTEATGERSYRQPPAPASMVRAYLDFERYQNMQPVISTIFRTSLQTQQ